MWLLGKLLSPEDWKWCLDQAPVQTPSPSCLGHPCLTQPPSTSNAMFASPSNMSTPTALAINVPSVTHSPPNTLNMSALTTFMSYAENTDIRMWTAQLQPLQTYLDHPMDKLEELMGIFESGSQGNEGDNVTVMETPTYSSFSLLFSFDDFISYAFPNVIMD